MTAVTEAIEYVRVERILPYPIGAVWGLVSGFGGIKGWVDGIQSCELEGEGPGAIRSATRGGHVTRERLETIDAAVHSLTYSLCPPHRVPATGVICTIALRRVDERRTELVWSSRAEAITGPVEELSSYIRCFYDASIDRLERLLA
jgi:hypothetical protein